MKRRVPALSILLLAIPVLAATIGTVQPPRPVGPVPSASQLAWQQLEYYGFIHFGMNTFTNHEWGEGRADPNLFQPTALDTRQWARVARAAGMKGLIITAKHHDGFCLWPSETTSYSVKSSSWRDGKGDILRELADACRTEGLKFGVYISPWDRNHPLYGTPRYNRVFKDQWNEILGNYGEVFESWLDGANDNKKRMVYDFGGFFATIRRLQPRTIIFSDAGPDIRWVGNEKGFAGETNWSRRDNEGSFPGFADEKALNTGDENGGVWLPAECDVSIRPGWFYHTEEDGKLKSVAQLMEIYYGSVGRNANLLLNIGVDRRGLVNENDEKRLLEFRAAREAALRSPLRIVGIDATNVRGRDRRFGARMAIDGIPNTSWVTDDGVTNATLELNLGGEQECSKILIQENIALGQRVKRFSLARWTGSDWEPIFKQTTIGYKRIVRFPTIRTSRLKLTIEDAHDSPVISNLELY